MVSAQEKRVLKAHRGSLKRGFLNIVTPKLISATAKKNVVFELSTGTGMDRQKLFGATVLKRTKKTRSGFQPIGGKMFLSKVKAKAFLSRQKLKFK